MSPDGRSDVINATGAIALNGGEVAVSLENSSNLLSPAEVRSLLGQQYNILSAADGITGQFDSVAPDYLFLGTSLGYTGGGDAGCGA